MNCGHIIVNLVKQISSKLDKNIRDHFSDCDLTVPQMAILTLLYENGEMKISDISSKMGLTNGTTSGIVDRLEKMELVNRLRFNQDRRVVKVILTEKSKKLNHDFHSRLDSCFTELFDKVDKEDLNSVVNGLKILNKILDRQSKY